MKRKKFNKKHGTFNPPEETVLVVKDTPAIEVDMSDLHIEEGDLIVVYITTTGEDEWN